MVDLNAHETGNGGKKPREAYSPRGLLYSEAVSEEHSSAERYFILRHWYELL